MQIPNEYIIGAIVTLCSAITYLYRKQVVDQKKTETKLQSCEDQHTESTNRLIDIHEQLGNLKGQKDLHDSVIKTINQARKNK